MCILFFRTVTSFENCLGDEVGVCISVEHIQQEGISKEDAVLWVALFAQFRDQCGPDYQGEMALFIAYLDTDKL